MFCTIKFVYYKSFCVRDDIGSYIRTVYHMVSHTPKRGTEGSTPLWDASQQRRKSLFSALHIKSYEKSLSLYEINLNIGMYIERLFFPYRGWIGALFMPKTMGNYKKSEAER